MPRRMVPASYPRVVEIGLAADVRRPVTKGRVNLNRTFIATELMNKV